MVFGATNIGFKHTDWMFTPWKILKTDVGSPNYGVVSVFLVANMWELKRAQISSKITGKSAKSCSNISSNNRSATITKQPFIAFPLRQVIAKEEGTCDLWWPGPSGPECPRFQNGKPTPGMWLSHTHILLRSLYLFVCLNKKFTSNLA